MLNIDDRLIKETLPKIKPNALAVLLAIAIHLNKDNTCFPSHDKIMKLTGLGSETVYNALKCLKKEGLLLSSQSIDSKHKTFSRRTFTVNTDLISIFVTAKNANPLEEKPLADLPHTAHPDAVEPHTENHETYPINQSLSINQLEQLNNEGEENTPTPEPQNLKEEKNKSGLVAPGRADDSKIEALRQLSGSLQEGLKEEIPPSKKVAPKKVSPGECEHCNGSGWGDTLGNICDRCNGTGLPTIIHALTIHDPELPPGVTIVEALPKRIEAWEHPNPTSPKELKGVLLRYADQDPDNWRDNVLEAGRATNLPLEKIDECLTEFCAWQFKTDFTKAKLSQYTAAFSLWLKRQKGYDAQVGKQVVNGNGQPQSTLPKFLQNKIGK